MDSMSAAAGRTPNYWSCLPGWHTEDLLLTFARWRSSVTQMVYTNGYDTFMAETKGVPLLLGVLWGAEMDGHVPNHDPLSWSIRPCNCQAEKITVYRSGADRVLHYYEGKTFTTNRNTERK